MLTAEAAASSDEDENEDVAGNVGDRPERASAAGRGTGWRRRRIPSEVV